ncbi:MAG: GMC family oxidoreductase [Betaproteobacteria bacterium]
MTLFDFVIVGGGTAGCVLADRLTADGRHSVLLLEAGGEPDGFWIPIPAGFSKLLKDETFNWRFETEPEPCTRDRVIAIPRGKGLGGSTLINGMIWVRGQPGDYDAWEAGGATGWNWASLEPLFRRIERYVAGDAHRGHEGPVSVEAVRERYRLTEAFLEAARQDGQRINPDYNGPDQEGFGYYQANQRNARRWSAYEAYLKPARARRNLTVITGAHATQLLFEGTRCAGVRYSRGGEHHKARAGGVVVLAAGAVQTPQLLELSGVGAPALLQRLGIAVRHALPGVGENYIDHACTRMNWRMRDTLTINELSRGWRLALQVANYFLRRRGILTLGTGLAHGFVKTSSDMLSPDAQYFFMHASYANAAERILDREPGMTLGVAPLRPKSAGSIHARSADPFHKPVIRPNMLSHPEDQRCLVEAMKIARRIVGQPALRRHVAFELSPGEQVRSDDEWLEFGRVNAQTIYHPIGTCRMGTDEAAVTDPRLRVRGLAGLRVADASVIPSMVSGNTQATVFVVAERAAELILEDARG